MQELWPVLVLVHGLGDEDEMVAVLVKLKQERCPTCGRRIGLAEESVPVVIERMINHLEHQIVIKDKEIIDLKKRLGE